MALSKTYQLRGKRGAQEGKELLALSNVTLSVEKQDIFGVIGLSGAGKSTLIRCLSGLLPPSSGSVCFDGLNISSLGQKELRSFYQKVGMVFQHFNLLTSRNVSENIAYPLEIAGLPKEEIKKRVDELLRWVGLFSKKDAYPTSLSGGEKQRVGIARALANHPQLLFCDEATSALDPRTTREILDLLKKINEELGVTIVLITHDMEVIKKICNQVAVIESGKIVEQGPVVQVFSDPKHPTTQHFIQGSSHEIPSDFFKVDSAYRKLVRLRFKGTTAGEPIIAEVVKKFDVEANILLGWLDRLQNVTLGTLVIELRVDHKENPHGIERALEYLTHKKVHYDLL